MSAKIYKTDHAKLDYLETIIMRSAQLETLISNLIDYIIEKKKKKPMKPFDLCHFKPNWNPICRKRPSNYTN